MSHDLPGGTETCRVVVVDDHPLWREALARDLDAAGAGAGADTGARLTVVGTAGSVAQALRVVAATRPDVVVVDLQLPDGSGVDVIRSLVAEASSALPQPVEPPRLLVVSASGEQADVLAAVTAGANGYLVKSARPEELVDAVRRTAAGVAVFGPGLAALVLGEMSRAARASSAGAVRAGGAGGSGGSVGAADEAQSRLTDREIQVLRLVAKGLSSRDAARELGVSHRTVQNHVQNVLGKLRLRNRVELTRYAMRAGLDDGD